MSKPATKETKETHETKPSQDKHKDAKTTTKEAKPAAK